MVRATSEKIALENGYHVVPRIHLLDRALEDALESDESWSAGRADIGFSQFSREEADAISNNDFIAIALSFVQKLPIDGTTPWPSP